jgi:Fe-S cluster biogenesis protein NfuA
MAKTQAELMVEAEKVLEVLREGISMHGGNVELIDIDMATGEARVRLEGACVGCPMSDLTLKAGIEETLCSMIPEIKSVTNVAGEASAT